MAAETVAPGAGHGYVVAGVAPLEAGPLKVGRHRSKALLQGFKVGENEADVSGNLLDAAGRQVELLAADVDPHVVQAHVHVRVPGQPEPEDVEGQRRGLIGNGDVDVLQRDDVAEIIGLSIVTVGLHSYLPGSPCGHS